MRRLYAVERYLSHLRIDLEKPHTINWAVDFSRIRQAVDELEEYARGEMELGE